MKIFKKYFLNLKWNLQNLPKKETNVTSRKTLK